MITYTPSPPIAPREAALLEHLRDFVYRERDTAQAREEESRRQPMQEKKDKGIAQCFSAVELTDDPRLAWFTLADGDSRFREGDRLCLHAGDPFGNMLAREVIFEKEEESRWLLRFKAVKDVPTGSQKYYYAEQDGADLTKYYISALDEIAASPSLRHTILPLLTGSQACTFNLADDEHACDLASALGLNARQADAVGKAFAAEHVACIQGPPGTGKTRVLALVARLMVGRGERVMLTSHTHTAINNALERIGAESVPAVKIGSLHQARALGPNIARAERFAEWAERPRSGGYVVGATPFATHGLRLERCEFDVILFDEASQITVPLALMAMRRGKRFVFIGDQQQLPPVVLSKSVLSSPSVFAQLTTNNPDSVMLRETYRMNQWLAAWPSRTFYDGKLRSAGSNAGRKLQLQAAATPSFADCVLRHDASAVFVPTLDCTARAANPADAQLVAALCAAARDGGLALEHIGIVTPFRAQGRVIRKELARRLGWHEARKVVADTVERMQGQERELVILSLATGDLVYLGAIAEFFFQRERLNVSVTRAMTKLVIIGPDIPDEFMAHDDELDRNIRAYRDLVASCTRLESTA